MGVQADKIEAMIEAGELERAGDPAANPRLYRETETGRYRIGCDAHGLWSGRWRTERQAQAVADFEALRDEVHGNLRSAGLAAIDAAAAGYEAASPLLAQAAALLARAAEVLEETPQTEGDGPMGGMIARNFSDPEHDDPSAPEPSAEPVPIDRVFDATRARIVEYEKAHDERAWIEGLNEGDRQRIRGAQREAGARLSSALVDQSWRVFNWTAKRAAAVFNGTLYTPCGQDDDGVDIVLAIPIEDVVDLGSGGAAGDAKGGAE